MIQPPTVDPSAGDPASQTSPPSVSASAGASGPPGSPAVSSNAAWDFVSGTPDLDLPDFSALTPEHLIEAGSLVVSSVREGVAAILASSDEPSFSSVTLPLERAKLPACSLAALLRVLESNVSDDALEQAVTTVSAQLTALRLSIELDEQLFARLNGVSVTKLIPEDRRLHELTLTQHTRAGVRLPWDDRETVAEISKELDRLETEFGQVLLRETASRGFTTDDPAALAGLGEDQIAAAEAAAASLRAARAAEAGDETAEVDSPRYLLPLVNTTQQTALASLEEPETRKRLFGLSLGRGSAGGSGDTRTRISDITALRAALAGHLGFHSFAQFAVDDSTAGDVEKAGGLLHRVLTPAQRKFEREADRVRAYFDIAEDTSLERHDIVHLWERYRAEVFDADTERAAEYFPFEQVLVDGVFAAASRLFGLEFHAREDLRGWHADVRVYEVHEGSRTLGLVLVDPFARTGKRGGAWMDELVTGSRLTGLHPVTTLTLNVPAPAPGRPALLSVGQTVTLFHEFGHVLHGLFADSSYPSQAGTAVPRDYVEFPSQQFEMWALHPQVLPHYARHWQSGEAIPAELIESLTDAQTFGQGFATLEYLAAAILDLSWHSLEDGDVIEEVLAFETEVLAASDLDPLVPPRYRSTYFSHIFSHGYAAGYYSYLWSEQYAAAVSEKFEDHGGLDPELARTYREEVLAPGYSSDPLAALERFLGGEASIEPLLRRRGLAPARPAPPACPEHARLERDLAEAGIESRVHLHPVPLPTAQAAAEFHDVPVGAIANSLIFIAEFEDRAAVREPDAASAAVTASVSGSGSSGGDSTSTDLLNADSPAAGGDSPDAAGAASGVLGADGAARGGTPTEGGSAADPGAGAAESSASAVKPAPVKVKEEAVLIMTSGAHRVDTEWTAAQIGALRLKRAQPEQVLQATGQAVGGVAPAGHTSQVRAFVDRELAGHAQLWAGGGTPDAMLPLTYAELLRVTGGEEIDVVQP